MRDEVRDERERENGRGQSREKQKCRSERNGKDTTTRWLDTRSMVKVMVAHTDIVMMRHVSTVSKWSEIGSGKISPLLTHPLSNSATSLICSLCAQANDYPRVISQCKSSGSSLVELATQSSQPCLAIVMVLAIVRLRSIEPSPTQ